MNSKIYPSSVRHYFTFFFWRISDFRHFVSRKRLAVERKGRKFLLGGYYPVHTGYFDSYLLKVILRLFAALLLFNNFVSGIRLIIESDGYIQTFRS